MSGVVIRWTRTRVPHTSNNIQTYSHHPVTISTNYRVLEKRGSSFFFFSSSSSASSPSMPASGSSSSSVHVNNPLSSSFIPLTPSVLIQQQTSPVSPVSPVPSSSPPPPFFSQAVSMSDASSSSSPLSSKSDEAIENMPVEVLLQQLFDGSWTGHDTIIALSHLDRVSIKTVSALRTLSDSQWQQLRLNSSLERSVRLYLLSTAQVEQYNTRMKLPSINEYSEDLLTQPLHRASDLGKPLPHSPHACSVCLPTWRHVIGYEQGTAEVIDAMACGYPRFFIHPYVSRLFSLCEQQFASNPSETCFAFPSLESAQRCATFLQAKIGFGVSARVVPLGQTGVQAVVFRKNLKLPVRLYWQHFGDIISSRYAWDLLHGSHNTDTHKAEIQRPTSTYVCSLGSTCLPAECSTVAKPAPHIKQLLRSRISAEYSESADNVYLYPSGMSAISKSLQMCQVLNPGVRSIQFGFPYLDALKVQTVFGPGCLFYPNADERDIDDLQSRLQHEKFSCVLVEFPANPLLSLPNLPRLSAVCRQHGIPMIVDDTVASFGNVRVFPFADLATSSLTKWFSGTGDVMAGCVTINSSSPFFSDLKSWQNLRYEDLLYTADATVLERNSRDFKERIHAINNNTERLIQFLQTQTAYIDRLYTPQSHTSHWDHEIIEQQESQPFSFSHPSMKSHSLSTSNGFGGLFSLVLRFPAETSAPFYDALRVSKGPSLGNNFTLCCPYTLLAHYTELEWAESVGINRYLLRFSVGLEDVEDMIHRFTQAFHTIQPIIKQREQMRHTDKHTERDRDKGTHTERTQIHTQQESSINRI